MKIISLGAGVQSSTMFLLSCMGKLPRADVAIFADTGSEPAEVYEYLDYLRGLSGTYGIPIETVTQGSLENDILELSADKRIASIPFFIKSGTDSGGMSRRQCTAEYKLRPIKKRVRELLTERNEKKADVSIGISLDETQRMKPSKVNYMENHWPLIDMRWSRLDCLNWYERQGLRTPPRSACVFCPFHNDHEWKRIKDNDPDAWSRTLAVDNAIRKHPRFNHEVYLHREMKPIDEIQFGEDPSQISLFGNECEGYCGI
ncbi:MAG: hypothetical protein DRI69_09050 [Bacteroidetes bacterium]|nr:MAG: hypothetical protein DRI69_09050 [Bacteroidota bacterium]